MTSYLTFVGFIRSYHCNWQMNGFDVQIDPSKVGISKVVFFQFEVYGKVIPAIHISNKMDRTYLQRNNRV